MNCKVFQNISQNYLQGTLSSDGEKAVEAHLESCPSCQQMLDECLKTTEKLEFHLKKGWPDSNGLDDKKQRGILLRAKYKSRISIAVFLLLLMAIFSIAGSFLSSLYYNWGGESSRLYRTQKTAALLIEFTFPNVTMPLGISPQPTFFSRAGWGHSSVEIKPYFVALGNYAMQKQVGKEGMVIGHLNVNQLFSSVTTQRRWADGAHQHYLYFHYPGKILSDNTIDMHKLSVFEDTWRALDILPEGTVAELALSFHETYSIEQVKDMFNKYDLDITWYALATGMEDTSRDRQQAPLSTFDVWGMPDLSRNMLYQYSQVYQDDYALREEYFVRSMEFLVKNHKFAERIYQGNPRQLHLEQRYQYIKDNGIRVYGVVVTGPTKELLKLKSMETVHSPGLGEVKLWNWFNRGFRGIMY